MLERLIELLRASLAASRSERTTLGQETALIAAYLDILRIRMGERLSYSIDVPPELLDVSIPPLSLQPLVENSIKHGLEPKLEGGSVRLSARAADGALQLDVEDDGLGFSPRAGTGVGLDKFKRSNDFALWCESAACRGRIGARHARQNDDSTDS